MAGAICLLSCHCLLAQVSVAGVIVDPDGAAVPDIGVVLKTLHGNAVPLRSMRNQLRISLLNVPSGLALILTAMELFPTFSEYVPIDTDTLLKSIL